MDDSRAEQKRAAAERAVEWVESGMVVGLGTGSTAVWAIRAIGVALADGRLRDVVGVPTSTVSAHDATEAGIPLVTLAERPVVDLTIDGADEVDPALNLIKGHGGALLREKVVAQASSTRGDRRRRFEAVTATRHEDVAARRGAAVRERDRARVPRVARSHRRHARW